MAMLAMLIAAAHAAIAPPAAAAVPTVTPPAPHLTPVTARPTAPARLSREQVLAAVRTEWSRHDGGNKGKLTPLEFSTWVMQAHGGQVAPAGAPKGKAVGIRPVSAMNASSTAFARADANHDGGVTPDEMASFLMLPASSLPAARPHSRPAQKPVASETVAEN